MEKVYVGKIVSFHGVKGEIRILSQFPYKAKAFHVGSEILLSNKPYQITSYRVHKQYDMITLEGYSSLDSVLPFRGQKVYKKRETLVLSPDEYLDDDLLSCLVINQDQELGSVTEVFLASPDNKLLRVKTKEKEILIPFKRPFIEKIDLSKKQIVVSLIAGME